MSRAGIGWDSHRLVAGRPLILGGVAIPHERGLDGHSDADALTHAIIDALLGAADDQRAPGGEAVAVDADPGAHAAQPIGSSRRERHSNTHSSSIPTSSSSASASS